MGKYHMLSHGFEKDRIYTDSRTLFEDRHIPNEFYFYKKIVQVLLTNWNGTCIILDKQRYKYQYKIKGHDMDDVYTAIYEKLSTLQWLMKRRQMFSQAQSGPFADPTRGQGRILAMLKIQPEIKTRELAYLLGIRQQSLNELLNKLEKSGHVERGPFEEDRRVMVVRLTEKGREVQQPETDYQEVLDCLSAEELQQFGEYLDRIIAAFGIQEVDSSEEGSITDWMAKARERMGEEQFEQLMSMRERAFGPFGRGRKPADIPGAERFSPNYDGFIPDRGVFGAFGGRPKNE